MKPSLPLLHPPRRSAGFTLIEVALAVAVTAFAIIGILGMFASGLQSARGTMNSTIAASIGQNLIQQYETQSSLNTGANTYRYGNVIAFAAQNIIYGGNPVNINHWYYSLDGIYQGQTTNANTLGGYYAKASITNNLTIPKLYTMTIMVTWPVPTFLFTNTYTTLVSFP